MSEAQWDAIWLNAHLATMVGADYGAIEHGALAVRDGTIAWVGAQADLPVGWRAQTVHDAQDAWITPEVVRDFRKSLEAAGARFDFFNFDGPHMFASPSSADYDAKVSAEARKYVTAFLKKHVFVFIAPPVPDR